MDLKNELIKFNSSDNFGKELLQAMEQQQDEFNKKLYLIRMLSTAKEIEKVIDVGYFKEKNIESLHVNIFEAKSNKKMHKIIISCSGENLVRDSHEREFFNMLVKTIFKFMDEIDLSLVSDKILEKPEFYLDLNPGVGKEILDLFLSQELKTIYEYNMMELELSASNENSSKKLKV